MEVSILKTQSLRINDFRDDAVYAIFKNIVVLDNLNPKNNQERILYCEMF